MPTTAAKPDGNFGEATGHLGRDGPGVTLLDVAALVAGAAVGSLHLRAQADSSLMHHAGWLFWIAFVGISVSAAGPFFLIARRFLRRVAAYPCRGDCLWVVLGLPWVLTAPLCLFDPRRAAAHTAVYPPALAIVLGLAIITNCILQWTWFHNPEHSLGGADPPCEWTSRLGSALFIAWPLQCGFALVALAT